jgi:hypothetical protein
MDVIESCLSLAPVPYLFPVFSAFRFVYSSIKSTHESKVQLTDLAENCADLLLALNKDANLDEAQDREGSLQLQKLLK